VGQNQNEGNTCRIADAPKSRRAGLSKLHREATQAKITPELLAKQHFDIRFVINHKNEKFHIRRPLSIASLHGTMTRAQETSTSAFLPRLSARPSPLFPQCFLLFSVDRQKTRRQLPKHYWRVGRPARRIAGRTHRPYVVPSISYFSLRQQLRRKALHAARHR